MMTRRFDSFVAIWSVFVAWATALPTRTNPDYDPKADRPRGQNRGQNQNRKENNKPGWPGNLVACWFYNWTVRATGSHDGNRVMVDCGDSLNRDRQSSP